VDWPVGKVARTGEEGAFETFANWFGWFTLSADPSALGGAPPSSSTPSLPFDGNAEVPDPTRARNLFRAMSEGFRFVITKITGGSTPSEMPGRGAMDDVTMMSLIRAFLTSGLEKTPEQPLLLTEGENVDPRSSPALAFGSYIQFLQQLLYVAHMLSIPSVFRAFRTRMLTGATAVRGVQRGLEGALRIPGLGGALSDSGVAWSFFHADRDSNNAGPFRGISDLISTPAHAVITLCKFKYGHGLLGHKASVIMWNADRLFQMLMLLSTLPGASAQTVAVRFPRPVTPAKVVPSELAFHRIRERLHLALRRRVARHFERMQELTADNVEFAQAIGGVAVEETDTRLPDRSACMDNVLLFHDDKESDDACNPLDIGVRAGNPGRRPVKNLDKDLWLSPAVNSNDDIEDYAINIEVWMNDAAKQRSKVQKPPGQVSGTEEEWFKYLYGRNDNTGERYGVLRKETQDVLQVYGILKSRDLLSAAARRWDKETSQLQLENRRKALEYTRNTEESFVASVVLASAMARAVIDCPSIVIVPKDAGDDFKPPNPPDLPDDKRAFEPEQRPNDLDDASMPSFKDVVEHYASEYEKAEKQRSDEAALFVNAFQSIMRSETFRVLQARLAARSMAEQPDEDGYAPIYDDDGNIQMNAEEYTRHTRGNIFFSSVPAAPRSIDPAVSDVYYGGERDQIYSTLKNIENAVKSLVSDGRAPGQLGFERAHGAITLGEACLSFAAAR
jgi:hypothetical protein